MKAGIAAAFGIALVAAGTALGADANFVASFSGMSDTQFTVEAVAPPEVIREYAICKAVWFAEKKGASTVSLSNPEYGKPPGNQPGIGQIPPEWISVRATAYLTEQNPSGNPSVSVRDYGTQCRRMWDWYR